MKEISRLEEIIGIDFEDNKNLLKNALTHTTYANEHSNCEHNERL